MTEKKHKAETQIESEEEINQTKAEAVTTPPEEQVSEDADQGAVGIEALKKQLEEAQTQASEFKDSWLRAQAEFQNYKKRLERDNEITRASMKGDIIKKVLPILDDLERAIQNRPEGESWASGIELIVRKFHNTLESEGVKKIEAEDREFDPNFHEAISHEPSDEVESGHVIAVVQNGYRLGERVIRPALVRVAQ